MPDFTAFTDAAMYFYIGVVATFLLVIRIALMLFLGFDADVDFDVDAGADVDVADDGFGLLSIFSVISFFAGFGWMGYTARTQWEWGSVASVVAAFGFGLVLMLLAASMMFYIRKLNSEGRYDVRTTVGRVGTVNLRIPEKDAGLGEVQIVVNGRQQVLRAKSVGPTIESFAAVKVVEVDDDGTLIVEPH